MRTLLALDQGTTSSRAIVFDDALRVLASAQHEFRQIYPQPGWVEHDPIELLTSQRNVIREALARAGAPASAKLAAVGITNQRETTLLWDRSTGEPLYNAIVWQDRRTSTQCAQLKAAGLESSFREKTGLVLDPYFSGTKLSWLLDHIPDARARAEKGALAFGTVDTWLAWHLSGGRLHLTDVSNASRTLLFNIHSGTWDQTLLDVLRIPASVLPEVRPSSGFFGELNDPALGRTLPLCGIAGDQQAALFGQGCHHAGMAKNTYGTGCFLLMHTGNHAVLSGHGLLTTVCAQTQPTMEYALEGSVFQAGAVVQWLRDGLGFFSTASEIEALAASVTDTGDVFLVPAFSGLGAPYWDADARGTLVGLTRGSHRGHIARAALESIAFQSADVLHAMMRDASQALGELRVDGGATANGLLMQFQADLLGVPVIRSAMQERTALGAAQLAGLGVGLWPDRTHLPTQQQHDQRIEPNMDPTNATQRLTRWHAAIERSRHWARSE